MGFAQNCWHGYVVNAAKSRRSVDLYIASTGSERAILNSLGF